MYKKIEIQLLLLSFIIVIFLFAIILKDSFNKNNIYYYVSSNIPKITVTDTNKKETIDIIRGTKVIYQKSSKDMYQVTYNNKVYLINKNNLVLKKEDVVSEKVLYVRTPVTLYLDDSLSSIKKGEEVTVDNYDSYNEFGVVNKYYVTYNNLKGYVYGKYLVTTKEEAIKNYDQENTYQVHLKRGNTLGGGAAKNLDYYPTIKPVFKDNVMPKTVKALYLNAGVLNRVDEYINLAKETSINTFIVDIKDNTFPGYESPVMQKYSITNYEHAANTFLNYQKAIKKIKDSGFYVVGRITVFKDSYYVLDHPSSAIIDTKTNSPFKHNGSYWPSAYMRDVWKFNVELAKEAVLEMGFNEIQFDYVRFPDRVNYLEKEGKIDFINPFKEEKAETIQNFLFYATDELHSVNAYISVDVFGESAHNYVTAYGQYWGAISNVVDVISPMPYPDHFSAHEYNFTEVVWTVPYKLINYWATNYVVKRQAEIKTPAIVRTWIQTHDTHKNPSVVYDSLKVEEQIDALCDASITGGFMTWSSGSSMYKYNMIKDAFKREC